VALVVAGGVGRDFSGCHGRQLDDGIGWFTLAMTTRSSKRAIGTVVAGPGRDVPGCDVWDVIMRDVVMRDVLGP